MFLVFDFKVKILRGCSLFLFLCIQQPSSFHLIYYFLNNLYNLNSHDFSKSDKNTLFLEKHSSSYHNEFIVFATTDNSQFPFKAVFWVNCAGSSTVNQR